MKKNLEQLFNEAAGQLAKGQSIEKILSQNPEQSQELRPLLEVAEAFLKMPKKTIPEPVMQRKFILVPSKATLGFAWLKFSKYVGASVSFMLIVSAILSTAYG